MLVGNVMMENMIKLIYFVVDGSFNLKLFLVEIFDMMVILGDGGFKFDENLSLEMKVL